MAEPTLLVLVGLGQVYLLVWIYIASALIYKVYSTLYD